MASTIELIKTLRDRTGAGMMDCKKALEESNNDIDAAIDWLRKKGIAKAASKTDRIAAEGLAAIKIDGKKAVIVEVNSETDFAAQGDAFKALVGQIETTLLSKEPKSLEDGVKLTQTLITDATVKIGEKMDLRRFEIVELASGQYFGSYIHMNGKIAVLLVTTSSDDEVNKQLGMHIACEAPLYINANDIPKDIRDREEKVQIELANADPKMASKPAEMKAKILQSKIDSVLNANVLTEQGYLMTDGKEKVGQFLKSKGIQVISFTRFKVGDGIEKKVENFAEEVAKQSK